MRRRLRKKLYTHHRIRHWTAWGCLRWKGRLGRLPLSEVAAGTYRWRFLRHEHAGRRVIWN